MNGTTDNNSVSTQEFGIKILHVILNVAQLQQASQGEIFIPETLTNSIAAPASAELSNTCWTKISVLPFFRGLQLMPITLNVLIVTSSLFTCDGIPE
jgi:hypothetical protein